MAIQPRPGSVAYDGLRLRYRVLGGGPDPTPVLTIPGGPGLDGDSPLPVTDLASAGRQVVAYDAIGTGRSDRPETSSYYSPGNQLSELERVRSAVGADRLGPVGHSYGGLLALRYALDHPGRVAKLIIASGFASVPQLYEEIRRSVATLPPEAATAIQRCDEPEPHSDPTYVRASTEGARRFNFRVDDWNAVPEQLRAVWRRATTAIRQTLLGPHDFRASGPLAGYSILGALGGIRVPCLLTSGRYDFASPPLARTMKDAIAGAELKVFERSAHWAMWEERGPFLESCRVFLERT